MIVKKTNLEGCFIIEPTIFNDQRGCFFESFNQQKFEEETHLDVKFVQDNQSISKRGTLRGLHFQKQKHAQAKLVRVIKGSALDIVVDIRINSNTFGHSFSIELTQENNKQLFIPKGFAHGFSILEDDTIVMYKADNYYNKHSESGIIYNDLDLNLDWKLPKNEILLSDKDKLLPKFKDIIAYKE